MASGEKVDRDYLDLLEEDYNGWMGQWCEQALTASSKQWLEAKGRDLSRQGRKWAKDIADGLARERSAMIVRPATRKGQSFSKDPDAVVLHHSDFEWEEVAANHADEVGAAHQKVQSVSNDSLEALQLQQRDAWERHYRCHKEKYFPIKNYTSKAFPALEKQKEELRRPRRILESGCGTGSAVLPLIKKWPDDEYYAFDISPTAVECLKQHTVWQNTRHATAVVWDVSTEDIPPSLEEGSFDAVLMMFVLSACVPTRMAKALERLSALLRPGGLLLFRDYGMYDHSQLRFLERSDCSNCFRVEGGESISFQRGDGTQSYYFSTAEVTALAENVGLEALECTYHCNEVRNRSNNKTLRKVFVNATLAKRS